MQNKSSNTYNTKDYITVTHREFTTTNQLYTPMII